MKSVTIDDIGLEIKGEMKTLFADRKAQKERREFLKPLITQVFEALENKQTVNGCTEKGEWAKFAGCTLRNLQHIAYGRKKADTNSVRTHKAKLGDMIIIGGETFELERNGERWVLTRDHNNEEPVKQQGPKPKVVDPKKDLLKRFYAARRAVNFFMTMLGEARCFMDSEPEGMGCSYDEFLEEYPSADKYLRKSPMTNYTLPKTIEELEAENDKAFAEFQKVSAEGEAMGVLAIREKPCKYCGRKKEHGHADGCLNNPNRCYGRTGYIV